MSSVINTNISSLIAQRSLLQNNTNLNTSLATAQHRFAINTGADDPAGLIAGLGLQQEQTGIQTAINNASLAGNVIGTAEGGLNEVSSLLTQLQGLVGQAANTGGLSTAEVAADQLQVDSILSTINRISQSTTFEGTQLLNGNLSYTTSGVGSAVTNLQVNSALVPGGGKVAVAVQVVSSAKTAALTYQGGAISGNTVTLQVAGNLGSTQLSFASGTTVSSIATAINGVKSCDRSVRAGQRHGAPRQFHAVWLRPVRQHSGDFRQAETGLQRHQIRRRGRQRDHQRCCGRCGRALTSATAMPTWT